LAAPHFIIAALLVAAAGPAFGQPAASEDFRAIIDGAIGDVGDIGSDDPGLDPGALQNVPPPPPGSWRATLKSAVETGDADKVATVVEALKAAYPAEAVAIEAAVPVPPPPPEYGFFDARGWDGEIEVSATLATGNSENTAFGATGVAKNEIGRWAHAFSAYAYLGGADGVRTQERFGALYALDATITDRTYAFSRLEYEDDRFSGFEFRVLYSAGVGVQVFDRDAFKWAVETGPGVRYSSIQQTIDADPASPTFGAQIPAEDSTTDFAAYAASDLSWDVTDAASFVNETDVTYTETTTTVTNRIAFDTKINGSVSTRLSLRVRYETDPPEGREDTDTVFKAAVVVGF